MVRGKTAPIRSLTDNVHNKVGQLLNMTSNSVQHVHPLSNVENVQPLSSLQNCITEAILREQGSTSFDSIYQYVSKNWTSGKRRESSAEFRRRILHELSNQKPLALFQHNADEDKWSLSLTLEQARVHEPVPSPNIPDRKSDSPKSSSNSSGSGVTPEEIQLTDLQTIISQCIIDHKGACHFDVLQEFVIENWKGFRNKDGQPKTTDCKRAILASLSKNIRTQPLFKRANGTKYWWQLGEFNPLFCSNLERDVSEMNLLDEPLNERVKEPATGNVRSKAFQKDNPVLTDLQILIIEALQQRGGSGTVNEITDIVSQRWGSLRRRDGTKYTADCKRAVQASLANNPSSRPIFRKEQRNKGYWSLGKRGMEYLEFRATGTMPEGSDDNFHDDGELSDKPDDNMSPSDCSPDNATTSGTYYNSFLQRNTDRNDNDHKESTTVSNHNRQNTLTNDAYIFEGSSTSSSNLIADRPQTGNFNIKEERNCNVSDRTSQDFHGTSSEDPSAINHASNDINLECIVNKESTALEGDSVNHEPSQQTDAMDTRENKDNGDIKEESSEIHANISSSSNTDRGSETAPNSLDSTIGYSNQANIAHILNHDSDELTNNNEVPKTESLLQKRRLSNDFITPPAKHLRVASDETTTVN